MVNVSSDESSQQEESESSESYDFNLDSDVLSRESNDWSPFDGYGDDDESENRNSSDSDPETQSVLSKKESILKKKPNFGVCSSCDRPYTYSYWQIPYILVSCIHTMCKRCIYAQLNKTGWTIECTLCGEETELPLKERFSVLRVSEDELNVTNQNTNSGQPKS